ncbi:hypothetical protein CEUSTIGMA_g1162.t1 [Chlamydomonas eustigma]|uniref:MINDY deubiquitinase domain-containing protein n=1 Tax=Chlamydomonas eustigma TaxID=1157962 RepID=A0A250WSN4_9CHLO|nr:hypothetical protein CEUSTIGMA_g1162.t1 [Chlamydomonas eustigma]|eukprot:GAX73709.1 hypothetical protein CEUSTIGMA_g1162.t1 [Chlamydomonas eustigma]
MANVESFDIKRIRFLGREGVPIFLQNENGPCPLLAIANCLSLKNQLQISTGYTSITVSRLISAVAEKILDSNSVENSKAETEYVINLRQNIGDSIDVLGKLNVGLDVNPRLHDVEAFEATRELTVFDLLDLSLLHGWVVDPDDRETCTAMGTRSYNELVEILITTMDDATLRRLESQTNRPFRAASTTRTHNPASFTQPANVTALIATDSGATVPAAAGSTAQVPGATSAADLLGLQYDAVTVKQGGDPFNAGVTIEESADVIMPSRSQQTSEVLSAHITPVPTNDTVERNSPETGALDPLNGVSELMTTGLLSSSASNPPVTQEEASTIQEAGSHQPGIVNAPPPPAVDGQPLAEVTSQTIVPEPSALKSPALPPERLPPVPSAPTASSQPDVEGTERSRQALLIQQFLEANCSQLTWFGLVAMASRMRDNQLAVFFRNNHFNVIFKYSSELYLLVTDQGYAKETNVVWEQLNRIDGDTAMCGPDFVPYVARQADIGAGEGEGAGERLSIIDYGISDEDAAAIAAAATEGWDDAEVPGGIGTLAAAAETAMSRGAAEAPSSLQAPLHGREETDSMIGLAPNMTDADLALAMQLQEQEEFEARQEQARQQQQQRLAAEQHAVTQPAPPLQPQQPPQPRQAVQQPARPRARMSQQQVVEQQLRQQQQAYVQVQQQRHQQQQMAAAASQSARSPVPQQQQVNQRSAAATQQQHRPAAVAAPKPAAAEESKCIIS